MLSATALKSPIVSLNSFSFCISVLCRMAPDRVIRCWSGFPQSFQATINVPCSGERWWGWSRRRLRSRMALPFMLSSRLKPRRKAAVYVPCRLNLAIGFCICGYFEVARLIPAMHTELYFTTVTLSVPMIVHGQECESNLKTQDSDRLIGYSSTAVGMAE
ncbi:hypothetical protein DL95DRAFT_148512 [Leptodontidium sp. 2 PMI_412]|nr:hypothetical protein DL95DRAFT_148512 [Leptodontidium sp. 2 PMI_412]